MTAGEKLVWAATYARCYQRSIANCPAELMHIGDNGRRWAEWEAGQTAAACEAACHAVQSLREIRRHLVEGYGHKSPVTIMYREMTDV